MSHFFVIAIVPANVDSLRDTLNNLMAPYDENFEVEPYKTECNCTPNIDPACPYCGGTGEQTTTYNLKSKWDWWRIGGRFDGLTAEAVPMDDHEGGFNFGAQFEQLERNAAPVEQVKVTPFAVLTPDGAWHQRGEMGWFGMVSDETDPGQWTAQVQDIYNRYKDGKHMAIGLDCHI